MWKDFVFPFESQQELTFKRGNKPCTSITSIFREAGERGYKMKYDYKQAMKNDITEYIIKNYGINADKSYTKKELENILSNELWTDDSVVCRSIGSTLAKQILLDNLALLYEMSKNFSITGDTIFEEMVFGQWDLLDSAVRHYLLPIALHEVLDDIYD